jgi:hypothetical protein
MSPGQSYRSVAEPLRRRPPPEPAHCDPHETSRSRSFAGPPSRVSQRPTICGAIVDRQSRKRSIDERATVPRSIETRQLRPEVATPAGTAAPRGQRQRVPMTRDAVLTGRAARSWRSLLRTPRWTADYCFGGLGPLVTAVPQCPDKQSRIRPARCRIALPKSDNPGRSSASLTRWLPSTPRCQTDAIVGSGPAGARAQRSPGPSVRASCWGRA